MADAHAVQEIMRAGRTILGQSLEDFESARCDILRNFADKADVVLADCEVLRITHRAAFDTPSEDYRELNVFLPHKDERHYVGRAFTPELFRELRERYPSCQIVGHPVLTSKILTKSETRPN